MNDLTVPPCDSDTVPLPAVGDRVRWVHNKAFSSTGVVHGVDPAHSTVLVLLSGEFHAKPYPASDWEVVP